MPECDVAELRPVDVGRKGSGPVGGPQCSHHEAGFPGVVLLEFIGHAAGDAWIAEYVGNCYHQTCDEWSPDWDLRGAIMDMELFHTIVRELGDSRRWPQWNPGSEFRAVRTKSDAVRASR